MKLRWWILLLTGIGLIVGPVIKNIPGFVVIVIDKTSMQFPLWLGVMIISVTVLLIFLVYLLLHKTSAGLSQAKSWAGNKKWRGARRFTDLGMIAFAEGNWTSAEKNMLKASKVSDTRLVNFLVAAQAAQKQQASERRDEYLKRAKENSPKADIAIGLTQARLQLESKQLEQALATLNHLRELDSKNPYLLSLLIEVNRQLKDWKPILKLLPEIEKNKKTINNELMDIKSEAICGFMNGLVSAHKCEELVMFWLELPRKDRAQKKYIINYAKCLSEIGEGDRAERELKNHLKKDFDDNSALVYSNLNTTDPTIQLDFLEKSLKKETDNYLLMEALAQLSVKSRLWGKARDYLDKVIQIKSSPKNVALMAKIMEELGETQKAQQLYKESYNLLEFKN